MFFAATDPAARPLNEQELVVVAGLLAASFLVYFRFFKRLGTNGPQTRPDLLGFPEMVAGIVVMLLFAGVVATKYLGPAAAPPTISTDLLLHSMAAAALPAVTILILIIARGGHVTSIFGLRKIGVFKALGLGFCLAIVALPLTYAAKALTVTLTASEEAPQVLVQKFQSAVDGGDVALMGLIALSACIVAPITEELIFRGTFYPMLSRGLGRVIAALVGALFFAFVHDTYTDVPGLTVLALCFTLAYEVTGSLLVPIFMHMVFNSISLLVLWWQIREGLMP